MITYWFLGGEQAGRMQRRVGSRGEGSAGRAAAEGDNGMRFDADKSLTDVKTSIAKSIHDCFASITRMFPDLGRLR
jgi:hypothetical protein